MNVVSLKRLIALPFWIVRLALSSS